MIDRTITPQAGPLPSVHFPEICQSGLLGGLQLYAVRHGIEPIVEIQLILPVGKAHDPRTGLAEMVAGMLSEGTQRRSGEAFARELDALGASFGAEVTQEVTVLYMSALSRNLVPSLNLLFEAAFLPAFDEAEIALYRDRMAQGLEVEQMKTTYQARKHFNKALFGFHPYGSVTGLEDMPELTEEAIRQFHAKYYHISHMRMVITGDVQPGVLHSQVEIACGPFVGTGADLHVPAVSAVVTNSSGLFEVPVREAVQCTVRSGYTMFDRRHPDHDAMQLVTMLFGGFFGSRLMKNIREDKGYTYGIYASLACMAHGGMLVIQADVAPQYVKDTLYQTTVEMMRMQDTQPDADEVEVVRNYMLGRMLGNRETPGQLAEIVRNALVFGIPFSHIDARFDVIRSIDPQTIHHLSQKWFDPSRLLTVVAGKIEQ